LHAHHLGHKAVVMDGIVQTVWAHLVQQGYGVMARLLPEGGGKATKKVCGLVVPGPPEVIGDLAQWIQLGWQKGSCASRGVYTLQRLLSVIGIDMCKLTGKALL